MGRPSRTGERLAMLALALAFDAAVGEPPAALHPVVAIGRLASALERRAPAGPAWASLVYGGALVAAVVGAAAGLAGLAGLLVDRLALVPRLVVGALLLKPTFAVRALFAAGERVRTALAAGDLEAARAGLRSLVSRDPRALDAPLAAAAAIESLAENASDSVVAPCLAYLLAGLPGAYAYRAANTLDAMIGYRGRYEHLGKCAARLDDLLNFAPARLTAALIVLGAIGVGDARAACRVALRDHGRTASPNAGWPMSAMAGALGVQLEKVGHYRLGDPGRAVTADDVRAAQRIVIRGLALGALALAAGALVRRGGRGR